MARVPVILLTRVTSPNALATALRRRGFTVTCTSDPTVARDAPEPVVVGPDWKATAPPADRAVPWIFLPPGAPLAAQVELVQAVVQAEPNAPSSVHATEAPPTEQLAQPSVLTATVPPGADPLDTLELTPVSEDVPAATWHGMGEEDTTEAVVQPRSDESHTLDLLDPNDTLDVLPIDEGHDTIDPETIAPQDSLAPWGLDPGLDPEPEHEHEHKPEPSHETLALPLDDRPLETAPPEEPPPRDAARHAGLPYADAGADTIGPDDPIEDSQDGAWLHGANTLDAALRVSIHPEAFTARSGGDTDNPDLIAGRYERVGTLGSGGMGEVWSVRDRDLQCVVAMKVIRPNMIGNADAVARFVGEAQATAQLQHPGIVPVHELGKLPDNRLFFTMQLVQGRTLRSVVRALHADSAALGRWGVGYGFSLRRLLAAMLQAVQATAYAHARGVLHRDLKPENIMLGDFGEVRVLDWGLARVQTPELASAELTHDEESLADLSPLSSLGSSHTRMGQVAGTPAFMSPEQAWGRIDEFGPHTDVYALGACLYALLSDQAPHRGTAKVALQSARSGVQPRLYTPFEVDEHLVALVESCLHPDWRQRPPHAGTLARLLSEWLDGARRRDMALEQVAEADARANALAQLRRDRAAAEVELQAKKKVVVDHINEQIRQGTPSPAPLPTVEAQWAAEDHLAAVQREEALAEVRTLQALRSALMHVPDLPEAHARLADHHRARFDEAETREDVQGAIVQEALVREHARDRRHDRWLADRGHLRLTCAAPGATARVLRCVEEDRRLVPRPMDAPFHTPQPFPLDLDLPAGSYVLEVGAHGHATVRYPALVPREGVWDAVPPEGGPPQPLTLPREDEVPPDACYVPAGWAWVGGRGASRRRSTIPYQRVWIDAFWAEPHPVTNRRYLAFLDALVAAGREAEALAHVPRYRAKAGAEGAMVYGRRPDGGFALVPDADGDLWDLDWPVVLVTWAGARAFAAWWAAETDWPWRLPSEHEWRKACGGVDGRLYPWGDAPVDHYANMRLGSPGPMAPEPVGSHPTDTSVYGVTGGAGGVMHWCRDPYLTTGTPVSTAGRSQPELAEPDAVHVVRGGTWTWATGDSSLYLRNHAQPSLVREWWGFRLVCDPRAEA